MKSVRVALRWSARLIAAAALIGATFGAGATPALAATQGNGICESGEFCFYFNSGLAGAKYDFVGQQATLHQFLFIGPGSGAGVQVKNNAASAWNRKTDINYSSVSYFNSYYMGPADYFNINTSKNLVATYNDNASWGLKCIPGVFC